MEDAPQEPQHDLLESPSGTDKPPGQQKPQQAPSDPMVMSSDVQPVERLQALEARAWAAEQRVMRLRSGLFGILGSSTGAVRSHVQELIDRDDVEWQRLRDSGNPKDVTGSA